MGPQWNPFLRCTLISIFLSPSVLTDVGVPEASYGRSHEDNPISYGASRRVMPSRELRSTGEVHDPPGAHHHGLMTQDDAHIVTNKRPNTTALLYTYPREADDLTTTEPNMEASLRREPEVEIDSTLESGQLGGFTDETDSRADLFRPLSLYVSLSLSLYVNLTLSL